MNLNQKLILYIILFSFFMHSCSKINRISSSIESEISLNGTWEFKYIPSLEIGDDSLFYQNGFATTSWSEIKVPGHWDLQGFGKPSDRSIPEVTGLYKTSFHLPKRMNGKQVFIRFDGVQYGYDFYVNGQHVGFWASSYNAATFNITDFVNPSGENQLAVKVTTRVKGYEFDINDCWRLSGIYRPVTVYCTPNFFIDDYTVLTTINNTQSNAEIKIDYRCIDSNNEGIKNKSVKGMLHYPDGKAIKKVVDLTALEGYISFSVDNPVLWTAETPSLYHLEISLLDDGKIIQHKDQNVGIRQISIEQAVLKLNGKPLKLRGVDHHDLVSETGRTLSRAQILNDLDLIKKANINFIRTSHYPPDSRMLDLCDSLGFYVMCEVPFGYGDNHLEDSTYQDILLKRAKATLSRDKNHPSIIIWSVGNENPLTHITEVTGQYVKKTDPSRLICYPQKGSYFKENYKSFPDFIDIYSPHYCGASWVKEFAQETLKPVIMTEYAHALGLSFGNLEDIWREMFRSAKFAGGAVWHFQDQGILQKAEEPVDRSQPTNFVWKDSVTYYDTRDIDGTDGIVYADRTPQVDYWQVRKVYSPVQVIETKLPIISGKQTLSFSIYNQFDFLNLNVLKGEWSLYKNREVIKNGDLRISCAPHDTVSCDISIDLPINAETDVWYLKLDFSDKNQKPVYKHTLELMVDNSDIVNTEILEKLKKNTLKVNEESWISKVESDGFCFKFSKKDLSVTLSDKKNGKELIVGGLKARVGRILKISDISVKDDEELNSWNPHLLPSTQVNNIEETSSPEFFNLSGTANYLRGENYRSQKLIGDINYSVADNSVLSVNYQLKPENASGMFLEAGVSFVLSEQITDFIWLGDGPYASYPDKHLLDDFGIHYLKKGDLNFNGNRANVSVAVTTDQEGNGIAIVGERSGISVEVINNRIIVSHNALLMGMGNKKSRSIVKINANSIGEIKGEFKIIPLRAGHWPAKLIEVLGYPDPSIRPFQPFYHSYDYSR